MEKVKNAVPKAAAAALTRIPAAILMANPSIIATAVIKANTMANSRNSLFRSILAPQSIARSANSQNDLRACGVGLNLLPQALDINGQGIVIDKFARRVPQFVKQLAPCDNIIRVADKHQQQAIFKC